MLKRKSVFAFYLFGLLFAFQASAAADLFEAIRNDDLSAVRAAAEEPAARESRGSGGATPLIYAAAFSSPESVRALIDAGADVNARTDLEATALIWAAGDPAKTEMLVRAGADVNAVTKNGRTPLLIAAARDGSLPTIQLLLDAGADMRATDSSGGTVLLAASLAGDTETVKFLLARGADANQADKAGVTPLQNAAANLDREMIRALLDKGARVNDANTFGGRVRHGDIALKGLTPLMLAAPYGSPGVVRMLLDAGADPNARDSRGMTPLMFASASSQQDPKVLKLLLARGADPRIVSSAGESALDWAIKFGRSETFPVLLHAGAQLQKRPEPVSEPAARSRNAQDAVVQAIRSLQTSEAEFFRQSACIACHHQGMTQIATAAAKRAHVSYNEVAAATSVQAMLALWTGYAPGLLERLDAPGSPDTQTFSLFPLAEQGVEPSFATDVLFANIAAQQRIDGSWRLMGFARAPMEESHIARTAMAIRALTAFAPAGRRKEMDERRERALAWLTAQKPRTTDDHVWRLLGLQWSGALPSRVAGAARDLIALQRADGGWAPHQTMASNAYATGTALWALQASGAVVVDRPEYQRGVRYLLSTQREDGTWMVRSRSAKFQPYFESGFPYGQDQWISAAATAWAAAALAPAVEGVATD